MSELDNEYKKIINDLGKNISNKEELEYVKNQCNNLAMLFIDEIQAISEKYEDRINALAVHQSELEAKVKKIQKVVDSIEKDIYDGEEIPEETYDFEIVCPYCNNEFCAEIDELKEEVQCPECKNIIELDWEGNCEEGSSCTGDCHHCHEEDDDDDDM